MSATRTLTPLLVANDRSATTATTTQVHDMRLVWANACSYNAADNEVHAMALELRAVAEAKVRDAGALATLTTDYC